MPSGKPQTPEHIEKRISAAMRTRRSKLTASEKLCQRCEVYKPFDQFGIRRVKSRLGEKEYRTYLRSKCKQCETDANTKLYWADKKGAAERYWRYKLKWGYGISHDEYLRMLSQQGGVCCICGMECSVKKRLSVDHDHVTGRVRGLLCNNCNQALGLMGDSTERLQRAAEYLKTRL